MASILLISIQWNSQKQLIFIQSSARLHIITTIAPLRKSTKNYLKIGQYLCVCFFLACRFFFSSHISELLFWPHGCLLNHMCLTQLQSKLPKTYD